MHRFFIAISRAVVNHDDGAGTSIDPLVFSAGSAPKRRQVSAVRNRAFLPGPPDLWVGSWISVAVTPISCRDIEVWPYSVGMLVKWIAFLSSSHWPAGDCNLGVGGVSYVELLILYELWAGERVESEKAVPRYRRPGRSISVSAVPFGPGTDIWRSCRFIAALFRGLRDLPFGLRVLITEGCGTLGGSGVIIVLLPGPVSLRLRIFETGFWFCSVIRMGLLLLCCLVFYPFGIVLPGLLVSFPLGGFLTGIMFVSCFLTVFLVLWFLIVMELIVICCLVLLVVLVVLLRVGFSEASKEFDSTEKHHHTLLNVGTRRVFSLVPGFRRDLGFLGLVGVQLVILMLCMSVIIVVMGLPWMTGLGLDSLRLHWPTSPGFALRGSN